MFPMFQSNTIRTQDRNKALWGSVETWEGNRRGEKEWESGSERKDEKVEEG